MRRRTFMKAGSAISGIGVGSCMASIQARARKNKNDKDQNEDEVGSEEATPANTDFEVTVEDAAKIGSYNGDDVYQVAYGAKLEKDLIGLSVPVFKPNDYLSVHWDSNIFGLKDVASTTVIFEWKDSWEHNLYGKYELEGSSSTSRSVEDQNIYPNGGNGWSGEFQGSWSKSYKSQNNFGPDKLYIGPKSIEIIVNLELLQQINSSGRVAMELAHVVEGDDGLLDDISICAAGVCYDFGNGTEKEVYDNGLGMFVP